MKYNLLLLLIISSLLGCQINHPHEEKAKQAAEKAGLQAVKDQRLDAVFLSPSVNLSRYHNLVLKPLDFSETKIINPSTSTAFQTPWQLTDEDKTYYQTRFETSAKEYLVDKGGFKLGDEISSTLALRMRIMEIAPLGTKDDIQGRPTAVDVFTRGFGRMTVMIELYDTGTQKLVFMATDEYELGTLWEKNNRVQNNLQIRLGFEYWMRALRDELKAQSKS